jgi:arsenical pump membrane protein
VSAAIDIGSITCITMILAVLFKPQIKVKRFFIDTYWPIALMGALLLVVFKSISFKEIAQGLTADTAINPIKILVLFISMTVLSIFLDEVGFSSI